MTVTKVLGAQAGIQYSGVSDKSEADPTVQLLNSVVLGQFKRGRFDKPFKVTSDNIRAKRGRRRCLGQWCTICLGNAGKIWASIAENHMRGCYKFCGN